MYLLAIDDFTFSEHGIAPALITDRSSHLNFGIDSRSGLYSNVFFGASAQSASWQVIIQCPDEDTLDALMAVLAAQRDEQVRLLAERDTTGTELVTIEAAVSSVKPHGSAENLDVSFESNDSIWTGVTFETASKTFTSALDQTIHLPAPGNVPTQPVLRITPTVQRGSTTAAVGWRYRQRFAVVNTSDEPWFRYPVRIPLGSTTGLVSGSKALASGADVRVWLHGLEQSRTLVGWNTSDSYLWVIVPALPPGEALTYEIVYGNAAATLNDGVELVYPELPAFDIAASTNYQQIYRADRAIANAGLGLWRLSSPLEGGSADYGVPAAWSPALTFENPNNTDSYVQPRAQRLEDDGQEWYQAMLYASRWRGTGFEDIDAYQGSDPYDGVVLYNPMGIRAVESDGIRWRNDAALKTTVSTTVGNVTETSEVLVPHEPFTRVVVIGRNSGGESWHVLTEYGDSAGANATSRLYLPSSGAAPISPAFSADWDDDDSADRIAAVAVKGGSAMADKAVSFASLALVAASHFTYATTYGSFGSGNTNFTDPQQIATDASGNIYVADFGNDRIKKHDSSGAWISNLIASLDEPRGVCLDSSGNVYVSYKVAGPGYLVRKYNSAGSLQWTSSSAFIGLPWSHLTTDGTWVYATLPGDHQVHRLSCSTGVDPGGPFGSSGTGDGQFNTPVGITNDGTYLYVVDQGNHRVQVFTMTGTFVRKWGSSGSGNGQLASPTGIAMHPVTGHLYVADTGNDRICCFTPLGEYLTEFDPGSGSGAGSLNEPTGLAFSPSGSKLYITEVANDRITEVDVAWSFTGNDLLLRQYVYPLAEGVEFSTADTVKGRVRAATEAGTEARTQLIVRVMTGGGTVRATLLGVDGDGMAHEFATSLTNREFPRGGSVNLEANYTTVAGDYLVLEYGARFGNNTVAPPGATLRFGDAAGSDLPENETATTDDAPWIEFSTDLFPDGDSDILTEAATWRPPNPVKHFGVAVWPQGGVSIPEDAESRVLVESDGDITVHIAAEPLVITQIEAETEIYELATEMRLHGGGNAVGPYTTLLVGNARQLTGPGAPRASLAIGSQALQIDTEQHTHTLWNTAFTTQAEALSAHAVRALEGYLREVDPTDIPALERILVTLANPAFTSNLTGWEQHQTDGSWSYTVTRDAAVGGGAMKFTLATTDPGTVLQRTSAYFPVQPNDSVEVTAWLRQSNSGTFPRIGVAWYNAGSSLLSTQLNESADVPLNAAVDHTIGFAATPPAGATQYRVVLGVTAIDNTPGNTWFDDVEVALVRPLRYDGSIAQVTEEARSSRWLPLAPARRTVTNGDFAATITGWSLESGGTGITHNVSRDGAVGGVAAGSLKIAITANSGSDQVVYRSDQFFAVNGADQVEMSAWVRTSHANIRPRLAILWYGDAGSTALATSYEPEWSAAPVANTGYTRTFAAIVPPGMTRFRLALVADAAVGSATGSAYFDDVRLNDNDLLVADVAIGALELDALVRPRWTP